MPRDARRGITGMGKGFYSLGFLKRDVRPRRYKQSDADNGSWQGSWTVGTPSRNRHSDLPSTPIFGCPVARG